MDSKELDDHQKLSLMKFRKNVSDMLQPHHDDKFLLRWLRARSWNTEAAEKMLRQSLKWRQEWEVDGALKTWKPPEPLPEYFAYGSTGYDKEGAPIIVVRIAELDLIGLLNAFGQDDILKIFIQTLEKFLDSAAKNGLYEVTVIMDMDQFSIRPLMHKSVVQLVIASLKMYEANYPEILKKCFVINAPRAFAMAFNIAKQILNEKTIAKMQIFKHNPEEWKAAILQTINPDNLSQYYGGDLTDPDGNPKCITMIKPGGKVPECYYKKNKNGNAAKAKMYETAVVKNGDKFELEFKITEKGSYLKWDFYIQDCDINFGVTSTNGEGKEEIILPKKRVTAGEEEECGLLECKTDATYTVIFDNSYSMFRKKKLFYDISIAPPEIESFQVLSLSSNETLDKNG